MNIKVSVLKPVLCQVMVGRMCLQEFLRRVLIALAFLACGHAFAQDSDIKLSVEEISKARAIRRNDAMHGFTLMVKSYRRLVGPKLSSIDALSMEDIHVLFELSAELAFYSNLYKGGSDVTYPRDMRRAYAILSKNGRQTGSDKLAMRETLEQYRDFRSAEIISGYRSNVILKRDDLGYVINPKPYRGDSSRPVLSFSGDSKKFEISGKKVSKEFQIIVLGGCHFASDAATRIDADDEISSAFEKANAIWIASSTTPLSVEDFSNWQSDHPRQKLVIAFSNLDWPGVRFDSIPAFHLFRKGRLVAVLTGWSSDEKSLNDLRSILAKNGLLLPRAD
ncbi:hypothetical protein KWH19_10400 [Xanthomonas campestris pv. pennamericanum]|nr:hypothetical protein [Xanthomonas campestris pv. pennamericanum]